MNARAEQTPRHAPEDPVRRIIGANLRQSRGHIAVAAICTAGVTVTSLIAPWPLKVIFDNLLLGKPAHGALTALPASLFENKPLALIVMAVSILLVAGLKTLFAYFQNQSTARVGLRMVHSLRSELMAHLQSLSLAFHNRARNGDLLMRVTGDTNTLKDAFGESAVTIITESISIASTFVVMLMLNWQLSLVIVATFPLLVWRLTRLYQDFHSSSKRERKQEGALASRLSEILTAIPLVQAYGREAFEADRFEQASADATSASLRSARLESVGARLVDIASTVGTVAVVLIGGSQVLQGSVTPGDLWVFTAYVGSVYRPARNLVKLSKKLFKSGACMERISAIFAITPEVQDAPGAIDPATVHGDIVMAHTSFEYEAGKPALRDVTLHIKAGRMAALVGASGAGKSTIISLLLRLYDPVDGDIFIDGINLLRFKRSALRRHVGVVFQEAMLFHASIAENIAYGKPDATRAEIEAAARLAHAHEFISSMPNGYDTLIGERGVTLSGGQRQRLNLARALVKQPAVLILDEPTSALDAESQAQVCEAIQRLRRGRTVIIITHEFTSLVTSADQVFAFKDGEIVERGAHADLLCRGGYYSELARLQGIVPDAPALPAPASPSSAPRWSGIPLRAVGVQRG